MTFEKTQIYLIGAGGNGKIVADICEKCHYQILGIFDDKFSGNPITFYHNYQIIGKINDVINYQGINIINAIGDQTIRYHVYQMLINVDINWINCICPNSYISPTVKIGKGNIICQSSIINSDVSIGDFNLINTSVIIEHDNYIGNFNNISPRTTLCGGVRVGDLNMMGASTTIIPNKSIGNGNIIGAATVVIKDVDEYNLVIGAPGRIHRKILP
jgi:acetyltransferase EpsM